VTFSVILFVVLAAAYGLLSTLLSLAVAAAWRLGLERLQASANELLAVRLIPAGGAALLTLAVVLPAFLVSEPAQESEAGGPLLVALASIALLSVGIGLGRAWRASWAARAFLRACGPLTRQSYVTGRRVEVVDVAEPVVAVVGGLRARIVASSCVISACSNEEFRQVVAHESAHLSTHDNLKLVLLLLSPDALAWLPAGAALKIRWRAAAEREADENATGPDVHKRLALASALIKVARLQASTSPPITAFSIAVAVDGVEGRVRGLLAPSLPARRSICLWGLAASALLGLVVGIPLYGVIHQCIETLVAFGR